MYSRVCFLLSRSSVHLEALDRRCSSSLQLLGYHLNYVKIDWLPWQWCSCAYGPSCKWSKQNMRLAYAFRQWQCHVFDSCNPIFPRIWSYCPTVLSLRPMFPIKRIEREPMFVSLMVSFTAHLKQSYGSDQRKSAHMDMCYMPEGIVAEYCTICVGTCLFRGVGVAVPHAHMERLHLYISSFACILRPCACFA